MITAMLALGGLAIPASAAQAQEILSFEVGTGTLLAGGAAVTVPVTVSCVSDADGPASGTFSVDLIQRRGQTLVRGGSGASFTCTGAPQTISLFVVGDRPFKSGEAVFNAFIQVCDSFACVFQPEQGLIQLRR
jgi:hypothetical protein